MSDREEKDLYYGSPDFASAADEQRTEKLATIFDLSDSIKKTASDLAMMLRSGDDDGAKKAIAFIVEDANALDDAKDHI